MLRADQIKEIDLVQLLEWHYGMSFQAKGHYWMCLSPFTNEREPSFVVKCKAGHWLFKDFSSGHGGSFIDFVMLQEGFSEVSAAIRFCDELVSGERKLDRVKPPRLSRTPPSYDLEAIYRNLQDNDVTICRDYLGGRGIGQETIDDLVANNLLLHNRHQHKSWCSFAVFDGSGTLCCLDNHQIDGEGKFVLGRKAVFSRDWPVLSQSEQVFVCEGIIDYLSLKTLEGMSFPGLALLGNLLLFPAELLSAAKVIVSALDFDSGGLSGFLDLHDYYPEKTVSVYHPGSSGSDPNSHLQEVLADRQATQLTATDKLALYREYIGATNKSDVALKWGINRSYMYEVVRDCEELMVNGFNSRTVGRKKADTPPSLSEASERITRLEEEKRNETREKERYYVRSEFLKLRLKWAEREAAGNYNADPAARPPKQKKKQIKKKKRKS